MGALRQRPGQPDLSGRHGVGAGDGQDRVVVGAACRLSLALAGDREERDERDPLLPAGPEEPRGPPGARRGRRGSGRTPRAMAWAWARWAAVTLDRPRWRTSPASRSAASAAKCSPIDSTGGAQVHQVEVIAAQLAQVLLDLAAELVRPGPPCHAPEGSRPGPTLVATARPSGLGRARCDQLVGGTHRGEVERGGVDVVHPEPDGPAQHPDGLLPVPGHAEVETSLPVSRIAPNPRRLTTMSPSFQVPAATAGIASEVTP